MTDLASFSKLVGSWTTEATHPAVPDTIVRGTADIEWLEGEKFLIHRASNDHSDFPDSISIIGVMDADRVDKKKRLQSDGGNSQLEMHYYDSRGVYRLYQSSIDDTAWRYSIDAPGLAQRFTGTFADNGATIVGRVEMRTGSSPWKDDLAMTCRRRQ